MEQHPVPQQISSYQFRLVGDMTLKQFFQLAGGALIALLFYSSTLPAFLKWPFIAFFALSGAALAFLPLEDRPLEVWVLAFFRSIYAPTLFFWNKPAVPTKYYTDDTPTTQATVTLAAATTDNNIKNPVLTRLEEQEKNFMSKITGLFTGAAFAPARNASPSDAGGPKPQEETSIPVQPPPVVPPVKPVPVPEAPRPATNTIFETSAPSQVLSSTPTVQMNTVQFSPEAAPPTPPSQANVIVGQVMEKDGKIVEGAILEVKDMQGRPVRALKTNRAGHFLIVTPLIDGTYELEIEKPDLEFERMTFDAKGEIIPPIAIHAK